MCYVEVRTDEKKDNQICVDIALRELKRKMKKEDIFQDLKRKEFYMAPSEKRRFRHKEAIKRRKRDDRKRQWFEKKS